jgi:hypothetical protein
LGDRVFQRRASAGIDALFIESVAEVGTNGAGFLTALAVKMGTA